MALLMFVLAILLRYTEMGDGDGGGGRRLILIFSDNDMRMLTANRLGFSR
jgi:hypothetical protein